MLYDYGKKCKEAMERKLWKTALFDIKMALIDDPEEEQYHWMKMRIINQMGDE